MAVYTPLSQEDIAAFLSHYDVGQLVSFKGIAEGVENTNYLLVAEKGRVQTRFILTVYEQRVNESDLPFFLGLTEWLADSGIACPRPIKGRAGEKVRPLKGKSAALIQFLEGQGSPHITPKHMALMGDLIARMHLAAERFTMTRRNTLSLDGWQGLYQRFQSRADEIRAGLKHEIAQELTHLVNCWPHGLPRGVVHADLFPDNVFFIDGNTDSPELSGVIDFYFACNDFWAYDLVICMNAWCFDQGHAFVPARAKALLDAYHKLRPLTDAEREAFPTLARGAAMRFLVTRCYDWLNYPAGALVNRKDPMEYVAKLRFHQGVASWRDYGVVPA